MKKMFSALLLCFVLAGFESSMAQTYTFRHHTAYPGNELNSQGLQAVHEMDQIVYAVPGERLRLDPPSYSEFRFYRRWFLYDNEEDLSTLRSYLTFPTTTYSTTRGVVVALDESTSVGNRHIPTILVPEDMGLDDEIAIACDQANYINYTVSGRTFTEPTLSQRIVFRIRNARSVATEVVQHVEERSQDNDKQSFYETIALVAPAGRTLRIGPERAFMPHESRNYFVGYFAFRTNGDVVSLEAHDGGVFGSWDAQWSLYSSTNPQGTPLSADDVKGGRYLEIPAGSTAGLAGQTREYYLKCSTEDGLINPTETTYNICRMRVTFVDPADYGPVSTPAAEQYLQHVELLYAQDFDYNRPGTSSPTYYNTPLPWEDATYGFYYRALGEAGRRGVNPNNAPYWSDYAFVNTSDGLSSAYFHHGLYNHGAGGSTRADASEGYFLYIDATEKPGVALNLHFADPGFCEGTTLWFSTYVANVNNCDESPHLDFVLLGRKADGTSDRLLIYTTGDFVTDAAADPMAGKWQRILFPFEMKEVDRYADFILSINAKGYSVTGNDLAIDDIAIFASKPPIYPIQAPTPVCVPAPDGEPQSSDNELITYLRIDYTEASVGDGDIYYRWAEYDADAADYTPLTDLYYYRSAGAPADWDYGYLRREDYLQAPHYASLEAFDAAVASGAVPLPAIARVDVDIDDRHDVPIIYIAGAAAFAPGSRYRGQVASLPSAIDSETCGAYADITIQGSMYISLDAERLLPGTTIRYCGNQWLRLGVERSLLTSAGEQMLATAVTCDADWLWGTPEYVDSHAERYGAAFDDIAEALYASRAATATPEQTALLQALEADELFFPRQVNLHTYLSADRADRALRYTAFPIPGTARDARGEPVDTELCPTPIGCEILVDHYDEGAIRIGERAEYATEPGLPTFVTNAPRTVRVSETEIATDRVAIPIFAAGIFRVSAARLVLTDDPQARVGMDDGLLLQAVDPDVGPRTNTLLFDGAQQLRPGYRYTFYLHNTSDAEENCSKEQATFTLLVVPSQVVWSPTADNAAWNHDANWRTRTGDTAFVPLPTTQVLLAPGAYALPETGPPSATQREGVLLETEAQPYISYDLGYTPYVCHDLFVPAGTTVLHQHLLDVQGRAVVEMQLPTDRWILAAMPVSGAVSGDLWTPSAGENPDNPFLVAPIAQAPGTYAADRLGHEVWQSLYNKSLTRYGEPNTLIVSSEWTEPLNALATPYPAGMGVGLWAESTDGAASVTFRFPKSDTQYRYFNHSDRRWRDAPVETIDRSRAGKAAYAATDAAGMTFTLSNHTPGRHFLMGNPALAYIDMSKFIEGNASVLTGKYDVLTETSQELISSLAGTSADGNDYSLLPPMRGVLLEAAAETSTLTLTLTPDMLTAPPAIPSKAPARYIDDDHSLYIAATADGFTARAVVRQDDFAEDHFRTGEDAMLVLLDEWKTPFGLYTLAPDNTPLTINRCPSARLLPLACFTQHPVGAMTLTFSGADAERWTLIDSELCQSYALFDGLSIPLSMPQNGTVRYYLNRADSPGTPTDNTAADQAKIYAFGEHNRLTVRANREMTEVAVYDMLGRRLTLRPHAGTIAEFTLPQGVYTVRVLTDALTQTCVVHVF